MVLIASANPAGATVSPSHGVRLSYLVDRPQRKRHILRLFSAGKLDIQPLVLRRENEQCLFLHTISAHDDASVERSTGNDLPQHPGLPTFS